MKEREGSVKRAGYMGVMISVASCLDFPVGELPVLRRSPGKWQTCCPGGVFGRKGHSVHLKLELGGDV